MQIKNDWKLEEVLDLFNLSLMDLIYKSAQIHRKNFNPNKIQLSTLLNIKTGACPEDCAYCSQSVHNKTNLERESLLNIEKTIEAAKTAKQNGASRFCMGAAWRNPTDKNLDKVIEMVQAVKSLGLETCLTLGMLSKEQSEKLKKAGLDYYNHNIDTSEEYYSKIITTRSFQDRLKTLEYVQEAGMKVCSGGIVGMGETQTDRANMLKTLANLPNHPHSVPINMLVSIEGTRLENQPLLDEFEFIKTIAAARIMMPKSYVRLSAGREKMSKSTQALCFLAGANSIFYGEELLTTSNQAIQQDIELLKTLGMESETTNLQEIKFSNADYQKSACKTNEQKLKVSF